MPARESRTNRGVALYLRVSTLEQDVTNQRRDLEAVARRHGWRVVAVFSDNGVSGAKGRAERPGLDELMKAVARRDVDMVAAWSVDRLGRSLQGLLEVLMEFRAKGVDLYLHQQGIDTSTPGGKAMYQMLGVFAELERELIRERVLAGMARAKSQGKHLGRPRVDADVEAAVRATLASGTGIIKAAKLHGVGVGTVQRIAQGS
jgi:DNA invertase Pin-like site-specific DNA recombinase